MELTTATLVDNPLVSSVSFSVSWSRRCVHNGDNPANAVHAVPVPAVLTVLTPGKGVPPQLPPQREGALLRAAGSPENPLALRCAPRRGGGVGTKGVPPHRRQEGLPARRRTKGGSGEGERSARAPRWVYFSVTFSLQGWLRFRASFVLSYLHQGPGRNPPRVRGPWFFAHIHGGPGPFV